MNKGLMLAAFVVMLGSLFAIAGADNAVFVETGRYAPGSAASQVAEGGNVTGLNLSGNDTTEKWQGFFGNVTGLLVLGFDRTAVMYDWSWSAANGGEVCSSTDAAVAWGSLAGAVAPAAVDATWGYAAADSDSATNTLTAASGTVNIAGVGYTSAATVDNYGWQTVVLNDTTGGTGELVWCVNISAGTGAIHGNADYEQMVPTTEGGGPGPYSTYYFYLELAP